MINRLSKVLFIMLMISCAHEVDNKGIVKSSEQIVNTLRYSDTVAPLNIEMIELNKDIFKDQLILSCKSKYGYISIITDKKIFLCDSTFSVIKSASLKEKFNNELPIDLDILKAQNKIYTAYAFQDRVLFLDSSFNLSKSFKGSQFIVADENSFCTNYYELDQEKNMNKYLCFYRNLNDTSKFLFLDTNFVSAYIYRGKPYVINQNGSLINLVANTVTQLPSSIFDTGIQKIIYKDDTHLYLLKFNSKNVFELHKIGANGIDTIISNLTIPLLKIKKELTDYSKSEIETLSSLIFIQGKKVLILIQKY